MNDPVELTYSEVEQFVHRLVWRFLSAYDLDRDEAASAAFLGYSEAYQTYDPELGVRFITWVGEKVKNRLKDLIRNKVKEGKRKAVTGLDLDLMTKEVKGFNLTEFTESLSDDAKLAVSLVFDVPEDIKLITWKLGDTPANFRMAMREFFRDLKWTPSRIKAAFREVRDAL